MMIILENAKKNTVIKFEPLISKKEFSCRDEWLYLITINNHIVKLGGTRTGLKGRIGSYLCGHHITERNKSGDCSKTNAYIYNTIDFYLNLNCEIKMFGYKLPKVTTVVQILDKKVDIVVQTYHAYESTFLFNFKTNYGFFPYLSDNCDPEYS